MTGKFITLEGGEGAGKSTQMTRLARRLSSRGLSVTLTREPGGSPRAEEIREFVLGGGAKPYGSLAEALLFSSARADHLNTLIRPALAEGRWVICDRFADSTRAYQGVAGALPSSIIDALEAAVVGDTRPDLTLVLDLPPAVGLMRASARRGPGRPDRFEGEGLAFHEKLRGAFRAIAEGEPQRCALIDATGDADEVEALIWRRVAGTFGFGEEGSGDGA